ncbi:hypothetical protein BHM03_00039575 [Ensete ventricosum]|nr:hypothetical protein BHM03_00039575 [Ensete ventricosum]
MGDAYPRLGHWGNAYSQLVKGRHSLRHRLWARHPPVHKVLPEGNGACRRGSHPWTRRSSATRRTVTYVVATTTIGRGQKGLAFFFGKWTFLPLRI